MRFVTTLVALATCASSTAVTLDPIHPPRLRSDIAILRAAEVMPTALIGSEHAESEILKIAQNYLTDQVNSVTENGESNRYLGTNQLPLSRITGTLLDTLRVESPLIRKRRDKWRGTPDEYDWAKTTMISPSVVVLGAAATMTTTEHTEMHYSSGGPTTSYSVGHKMVFTKLDGTWKIASDILENTDLLEPYHRTIALGTSAVQKVTPGRGSLIDRQEVETPESRLRRSGVGGKPSRKIRMVALQAPGPVPYNRNAAAAYAFNWADNYVEKRNPRYVDYENDCTNFVSQALRAGGWSDDRGNDWWADNAETGYGNLRVDRTTLTGRAWRLAHGLYEYARNVSRRAREFEDGRQAALGDIVFADWSKPDDSFGTDGHMDHAMIVTQAGHGTNWREVRVSYHTTDRQNIRMGVVADTRAAGQDVNLQRFHFLSPAG